MRELLIWFLTFARIGALLAVLPPFSGQNVPVRVRIGFAGLVAFLISPLVTPVKLPSLSLLPIFLALFAELSVGLLLGLVVRFFFAALELGGSVMATEMGLMTASEFNPHTQASNAAPALILYWFALMLLFSLDLHEWLLFGIQRTFTLVPIGQAHLTEALLYNVIRRSGQIFLIGVQIAGPLMAVSFIVTLALAVLGRAVPQMNVFAESFGARSLAGLIMFGLCCSFLAEHIANYLRRLPEDMLRIAQLAG